MNKKVKSKKNKIIIAILVVMICNFVMPNLRVEAVTINGGIFFKPIAQFIAWLADISLQMLQSVAIGDGTMKVENSKFYIRYSPAIIFSGKIPMFDINFINPDPDYEVAIMVPDYGEIVRHFSCEQLGMQSLTVDEALKKFRSFSAGGTNENTMQYKFFVEGDIYAQDGTQLLDWEPSKHAPDGWMGAGMRYESEKGNISYVTSFEDYTFAWHEKKDIEGNDIYGTVNEQSIDDHMKFFGLEKADNFSHEDKWSWNDSTKDRVMKLYNVKYKDKVIKEVRIGNSRLWISDPDWKYVFVAEILWAVDFDGSNVLDIHKEQITVQEVRVSDKFRLVKNGETIPSIAGQLRPFVATWYNVFKVFALVALLVVLVYVAIRMILSSASKDKAKYKKMLADWITAVCIIFIMQYIISLIFTVTGAITDFFSESVVGIYGEDLLMSHIRTEGIGANPTNFMSIFAQIVMYVTLVVYTILFTIQYFKRTIYMAFLTLISPLVAFTYPLDKLKDGKAQAFSAWLREFIYTSLVQPVHLIVYCLLVDSAIYLAKEVPVYAIMVIGFLLPAEKFVKKMFGLDRANTIGNMASAFGGAAIMNGINKLGLNGPKGKNGKGGGTSGEGGNSEPIRTVSEGQEDPYDVLRENESKDDLNSGGSDSVGPNNIPNLPNQAQNKTKKKIKNKPRRLSGVGNVAKKYVFNKNTAKGILKGGAKLAGAAMLGTIGLAAGIATGDMKNAFAGAIGGISAGKRVGGNLVDRGENLINGVSEGISGVGETFREGAYGKDEYERMKFDKEFKQSAEYIKLISKYPGKENDVQQFLNAGITDVKMMQKAIENKYNTREAIAYMKMAQAEDCPDEVLYDREKFKTYLEARGIPESKAEEIRKGILQFK